MKKRTEKMRIIIIFLLGSIFLLSSLVSAANIGVSPATIKFENVLRGGYSENTVVISVDTLNPVDVELDPRGEIEDWLNFSYENFSVSKDEPYYLRVAVTPPIDTPNGNYTGFLRLRTSGFGEGVEGHAVGIVRSALDLVVNVEVIDVEIANCNVYNYNVNSVEKGDDVIFNVDLLNNGNIRLKPRITIDIWDQDEISIVKSQEYSDNEILPTVRDVFELRMDTSDLEIGQYWAEISTIDCYSSRTLTFDVLEEGALKAEGVLQGISVKRFSEVGETVPINIKFKNTGEKEVDAQFKGRVTLGEKIVQILESDAEKVPVGNVNEFTFFFTPQQAGRYAITGRVFYNGKKTFELSSPLEVFSRKSNIRTVIMYLIYALLIFLILFLFFKIRKERNKLKSRLRRFE